jgi:hypothetical protein
MIQKPEDYVCSAPLLAKCRLLCHDEKPVFEFTIVNPK